MKMLLITEQVADSQMLAASSAVDADNLIEWRIQVSKEETQLAARARYSYMHRGIGSTLWFYTYSLLDLCRLVLLRLQAL